LVNAHHHLLQTAFRTLPGTRGVPMREWLPRMAAAYAAVGVDAELARTAAAAGLAEALALRRDDRGRSPPHLAVRRRRRSRDGGRGRAAELGARLVFVRGSARDDPEQAAASAEAIASALGWRRHGMVQVAVGPAGVHSDSEQTFALLGEVAARTGCAGGRKRVSRSTSRSPWSATGDGHSSCSTSGAGSRRTSPWPTCAASPRRRSRRWRRRA
jgi:cytosine/adenosine deaminase-related metal-dependent hydrolase